MYLYNSKNIFNGIFKGNFIKHLASGNAKPVFKHYRF